MNNTTTAGGLKAHEGDAAPQQRESGRVGYLRQTRPYIVANDLGLRYPLGHPYMNVNMVVPRNSLLVLRGDHSTGKTPLLLTLAGRMRFNRGTLTVGNYVLPKDHNRLMKVSGMGLFENLNDLEENLKTRTHVRCELEVCGRPHRKQAVQDYLEMWGLGHVTDMITDDLTAKEKVWLGVALGMAKNPEFLVVDDVESNLTNEESLELMNLLADIAHKREIVVAVGVVDPSIVGPADYVYEMESEGSNV